MRLKTSHSLPLVTQDLFETPRGRASSLKKAKQSDHHLPGQDSSDDEDERALHASAARRS
eukprot:CAMPEP_0119280218 /NCGR_PEP_ID=MMETSP1329-20130426/22272_1 /TAXON_ID=114041 /ORGANISM="Genus nov. species nov., Strain RCC1024" /LENGTH=59 /DNA_ID=CAMNT_0007280799 /DNA_START=104 /DNA_END=280 /DNA_ORIENTATION=-